MIIASMRIYAIQKKAIMIQNFRNFMKGRDARAILVAGVFGEIAFEFYALVISPVIFSLTLQPAKLVMAIASKLTGLELPIAVAFPIHFLIGSIGFGVLVYLARKFVTQNVWLSGGLVGVSLWFVAQGVLAPFVGRSFMMDFGPYTQSSFVGHVGMTLIIAYLLKMQLQNGQSPAAGLKIRS